MKYVKKIRLYTTKKWDWNSEQYCRSRYAKKKILMSHCIPVAPLAYGNPLSRYIFAKFFSSFFGNFVADIGL